MSEISRIEQAFAREDVPAFVVGDTVDVHVRIREGDKERIQIFNGTVIRRRGGGLGATYTVRRIVQSQGVERTFPLHSPFIKQVVVKRSGKVRRARLYYLRNLTGKATRLKEIITRRPDAARKAKRAPAPKKPAPAAEPEAVEASEAAKD
jgi:large subunit ribosomal protein L19